MGSGQLALRPSASTFWARRWRRRWRPSPQQQQPPPRRLPSAAAVSDESAELLQLDTERHVSARSCFEPKYARVIAAERQSIPVLTLLHAVHAAHTYASCITLNCPPAAVCRCRDDTEADVRRTPHSSLDAKGESLIHPGAAEKPDRTRALCHLHVVCQGNRSHRSPTLVHVTDALPGLQSVRG